MAKAKANNQKGIFDVKKELKKKNKVYTILRSLLRTLIVTIFVVLIFSIFPVAFFLLDMAIGIKSEYFTNKGALQPLYLGVAFDIILILICVIIATCMRVNEYLAD